jgi:hypothetical protein
VADHTSTMRQGNHFQPEAPPQWLLFSMSSLRSYVGARGSAASAGPCRSHFHSEFAQRNEYAAESASSGQSQTYSGLRAAGDQIQSGPPDSGRGNKTVTGSITRALNPVVKRDRHNRLDTISCWPTTHELNGRFGTKSQIEPASASESLLLVAGERLFL